MQNKVEESGDIIEVVAPANVSSGGGVLVGALFGIAITDAASGETVAVQRRGVFTMEKTGSAVFTQGERVYFDPTSGRAAKSGAGNVSIGVAAAAAGNGPTVIDVALDGTVAV